MTDVAKIAASLSEPPHRYVQARRCPGCDGTRLFGEPTWMVCGECGWTDSAVRDLLQAEREDKA